MLRQRDQVTSQEQSQERDYKGFRGVVSHVKDIIVG